MTTDAELLRGYVGDDAFVRPALDRVLLRGELNALDENSTRFLMREWKAKAEDYRRERDALIDALAAAASTPCLWPTAMATCMDGVRGRDPSAWCRYCWVRHILRAVVV